MENNKKKKIITPLLGQIFKKIAPRIGAKVIIEPEWGFVGQIIFKNGRKRYFRYSSIDLNPLGASDIATDKGYASFFMNRLGYPIIPGQVFFSDNWSRAIGSKKNIDAAHHYAQKIGWPLIVKPNSGSQGAGVFKVTNKSEFYRALRFIFRQDRVALVQKLVCGRDYRLVVLDKQVISAYERRPFNIVGDGVSSVERLIKKKLYDFMITDRPAKLDINDWRIAQELKKQKLTLRSVLPAGVNIFLLANANLTTGGDAVDVTKIINSGFKKLAIRLTKDMGLRFCGVDLMVDGDISQAPRTGNYWIIEINAAPGLDHYVKTGREQVKIVENMYLRVLKAMEK